MDRSHLIFGIYTASFAILFALIIAIPIASFSYDESGWYKAFAATCHQKISRSLCIFSDYSIGDCKAQSGQFVTASSDRTEVMATKDGRIGYKMPVCSRDVGLYGAILLAALAYPFFRRIDDYHVPPPLYLILAIVPLALDGSIQLLSDFGWLPFIYESTNLIRLITGIIAGVAATAYAIPLLMNMFGEESKPGPSAKSDHKEKTR